MALYRFLHWTAPIGKAVVGKVPAPRLLLQCHVKPRASSVREGVIALTENAVHFRVAAIPRDGEANTAVLATLGKALGIPKTDLEIIRGLKSKDKTIAIHGQFVQDGEACESRLVKKLEEAAARNQK